MLTISFKKGDIFEYGMQESDVIAHFGYKGKVFDIPFKKIKEEYSELQSIYNPFEQSPSELISFGDKNLFCVPNNSFSDDSCSIILNKLLDSANRVGAKNIVMNRIKGVDSYSFGNKQSKIEEDNKRVNFIVEQIKIWFESNKTETNIENITLIASSDIFTRNKQ